MGETKKKKLKKAIKKIRSTWVNLLSPRSKIRDEDNLIKEKLKKSLTNLMFE
jgi:hypothetical protein